MGSVNKTEIGLSLWRPQEKPKMEDFNNDNRVITQELQQTKEWVTKTFSRPNLLINGDFSVWQRGVEFDLVSKRPIYTADRWIVVDCFKTDNTKVLPSKDVPAGETGKSMSFVIKEEITEDWLVYQYLEEKLVPGEKYTLSAWVKGPVGATICQSLNTSQTPPYTLTGDWQFIQSIHTKDSVGIGQAAPIRRPSQAGTYYLKNVKLERGSVATPFAKKAPGEELLLCQRYYLHLPKATKIWITSGYKDDLWCGIYTPVPMRIAPILKNPGGFLVGDISKRNEVSDMTFSGNTSINNNLVEFSLHKENHGFTAPYALTINAGMILNADIYNWETPE